MGMIFKKKDINLNPKTNIIDVLPPIGWGLKNIHILDDKNAILLYENSDEDYEKTHDFYYMKHCRLENEELVEVSRWNQSSFSFGGNESEIIRSLNLFMVQGGRNHIHNYGGVCNALYDYENDRFVVEKGDWDCIGFNSRDAFKSPRSNINFLREYECFVGSFRLSSDEEKNITYYNENPINHQEDSYEIKVYDGIFFGILNPDGSIRDNKLFKGSDLAHPIEVIDLNNYDSSLDAFKQTRIQELNKLRNQKLLEYRNKHFNEEEPVTNEVLKTLNLKLTEDSKD